MVLGTHSEVRPPDTRTRPRVRPRVVPQTVRYVAAFAAIGCTSKEAIARAIDMNVDSVSRALEGAQIGEPFIAASLSTLDKEENRELLALTGIEPTFHSIFEIVVAAPDGA